MQTALNKYLLSTVSLHHLHCVVESPTLSLGSVLFILLFNDPDNVLAGKTIFQLIADDLTLYYSINTIIHISQSKTPFSWFLFGYPLESFQLTVQNPNINILVQSHNFFLTKMTYRKFLNLKQLPMRVSLPILSLTMMPTFPQFLIKLIHGNAFFNAYFIPTISLYFAAHSLFSFTPSWIIHLETLEPIYLQMIK